MDYPRQKHLNFVSFSGFGAHRRINSSIPGKHHLDIYILHLKAQRQSFKMNCTKTANWRQIYKETSLNFYVSNELRVQIHELED